jgi:dihydroxy-acid dehydratase
MGRRRRPEDLRSHRWFGVSDLRSFGHRSRIKQIGYAEEDYAGKPVIGIINTWSDINPCHYHFRERVEEVKRGVWQAGGFPLEFPAISLAENFVKPTTMLYRNFLAMETEELLRQHPIDGAVLMGGCDKTTPGLIMGAVSMGLPAIFLPAGPMLRGNWEGKILGSGSDAWKYWDEKRAGNISEGQWREIENGIARSFGHCMTMGTASTMTAMADVLGLTLPGASSIPAADSNHPRMATATGRRIVEMVWQDLKPADVLTPASFTNAIVLHNAMGGSTNCMIHLVAMARRAGIDVTLERFDQISREVPVIANVRPSGEFLMEDFYYAGGLPALLKRLSGFLDLSCRNVADTTLQDLVDKAEVFRPEVIRTVEEPVYPAGGTAILKGNIAPDGAVMKPSACEPRFLKHRGRALVFEDYDHMASRIERDDLDCDPDTVLVLKNSGPKGGPGMPEWGMLPLPRKLVREGVRDMLRISDARMSGTSYGACILHVAPESYIGGPLALVQTGDAIEVDVGARRLHLDVSEGELAARRAAWIAPAPRYERGYGWMFSQHILQANDGCDFDFLRTGAATAEPEIH